MISEHSEEEWFNLLLQGEEAALDYFIRIYSPVVERYVLTMVHHLRETEEITSSTFLKLWEGRQTLKSPKHLVNFLYKVAKRAALDNLKRQKTLSARKEQWNLLRVKDESEDMLDNKETEQLQSELMHEVNQRVATMPPGCREVFLLRYREGKEAGEIARQLTISPQTVYNQLAKAISILRKALKEKKLLR